MWGIKGIDHIAQPGLLSRIIAGSYPSGPSSAEPPQIWQMIAERQRRRLQHPLGHPLRHASRRGRQATRRADQGRPRHLRRSRPPGLRHERRRRASPVVDADRLRRARSGCSFRRSCPTSRSSAPPPPTSAATSPIEHEGGLSRRPRPGARRPQQWRHRHRPGQASRRDRDTPKPRTCVCRGSWSTTSSSRPTSCRRPRPPTTRPSPARSSAPLSPRTPPFGLGKIIARRAAMELQGRRAVNLGFGISAIVPRILLEEGPARRRHLGHRAGSGRRRAAAGLRLRLRRQCRRDPALPAQFTYFQGGGFDRALLSFLADRPQGSVNVSSLPSRPHVTAGAGGFVDITARAKEIVFSGYFTAGAAVEKGQITNRAARARSRAGARWSTCLLLRAAAVVTGPGHEPAYCHRGPASWRADAQRGRRHRDRAGHRAGARWLARPTLARCCRPTT